MNTMKKRFIKVQATFIALAMMLSILPVSVFAAAPNTPKEEVVYINLAADGSVKEINIVNIFDLEKDGQIIDYGSYDELRNMTSTDSIEYSNDTVTINTAAGKLYYEGKLTDTTMPWDISIQYYMDGKEYPANKIAGMSGKLKIKVTIKENKDCKTNFFDGYALQASLTLNTEKCSNITTENATIANVGSDKQLTYTILPGKGADIEITADVIDFEMDGIAINGIPLNLNIEVDDSALISQITQLLSAIQQLDKGASSLHSGVSDLQTGAQAGLKDGVNDLQSGAEQLQSGAAELQDGGSSVQSGAQQLQDGAAALEKGVKDLNDGIIQIQQALNTLHSKSPELVNGSAAFLAGVQQLQNELNNLTVTSEDLTRLIDISNIIKKGITELVTTSESLQQSLGVSAFNNHMANNGINIDSVKQNNANAINTLQNAVAALNAELVAIEAAGLDTTAIRSQIEQIQSVTAQFSANNTALDVSYSFASNTDNKMSTVINDAKMLLTLYNPFHDAILELVNALDAMPESMSKLTDAVNTIVNEYQKIDTGINSYTGAVAEIINGYSKIVNGAATLANSSSELATGASTLHSGTSDLLNGIVEIYNGAGSLKDGTGNLDEGVAELLAGIAQLYDGSDDLKKGASAVKSETSGMDYKISAKVDALLESITGSDIEVESFVSDKNTNIESVQFVIKTEGVHVESTVDTTTEEATANTFWDKLLALFKK